MIAPSLASDRCYVFAASPAVVWAALERVDAYRTWWPWLERFDGADLRPGAEWRCAVRSPLWRTLRFTVTIDAVEAPRRICARLAGDLDGPATVTIDPVTIDPVTIDPVTIDPVTIDPAPGGVIAARVRLVSQLVARDAVMATVTRFARPVARRAHDVVVDRGARQFAASMG